MEHELNIEDEKVQRELDAELKDILGPRLSGAIRPDKREESPQPLGRRASGQPAANPWLFPAQLAALTVVTVVLVGLYWKTTPKGSNPSTVVPSLANATDPGTTSPGPVARTVPDPSPSPKSVAERKEQVYNDVADGFRQDRWHSDQATRKRLLQRIGNLEQLGKQTHDKEAVDLAKVARERINTESGVK